jgi:hypothetical protein
MECHRQKCQKKQEQQHQKKREQQHSLAIEIIDITHQAETGEWD